MLDKLYAAMLTLTGIGFGSYVLLEEATSAVAGEQLGEKLRTNQADRDQRGGTIAARTTLTASGVGPSRIHPDPRSHVIPS
ncbi:hypothetical protein [Rhodococcus sp. JVH1]|uniref:hypothetical protein n=1 Tax=Rhodococcus sp. JVH1 TaxID=745408 RepID=UPI00027213BD|nr:hypothetical protein [Rhodococcus sp. JVH1]EJI93892.1 hypothetical protein JVH1_8754 [Rhodococcus sp. JVH1]